MESVWYYASNGIQTGPVSWVELKEAASAGKLSPGDFVWKEGTPNWVQARTVVGLFPAPPLPPSASAPPAPTAAPEPPWYDQAALSPPMPSAEPLSLDDETETAPKRKSKRRREREFDDEALAPGLPEWVQLIPLFVRRTLNPDPSEAAPAPDEEEKLTRSGVMDPSARRLAVWRRSALFVAAAPCLFAALFSLIDVAAMGREEREPFSLFGMFLLYLQGLALFALPAGAVAGALLYDRLSASMKAVLVSGVISLAVPIAVAFVPSEWLLDLKESPRDTVEEAALKRATAGMLVGINFYLLLMPTVLSLLPAVSRACVRTKLLLPESLVPGWGLVTSIPLCVLLTLATFVLLYHIAGNTLLILGLLLWVSAPMLYLTKFSVLTRPVTSRADRAALARTSLAVFCLIVLGVVLLAVYLFTAKVFGKTLVGFDDSTSAIRPWNIDIHRKWIEYVGRSLFLTVFFADLLLRMALSVWREERAFAGTPPAAEFDRTMASLGSAILPRG